MSICAYRMAETEFWTPCSGCRCGREVADALVAAERDLANDEQETPQ